MGACHGVNGGSEYAVKLPPEAENIPGEDDKESWVA